MPPRTPLLELAIRRNTYVCRSCVAALGLPQQQQQQQQRQRQQRPLGRPFGRSFGRSFTSSPKRKKGGGPSPPKTARSSWDWENFTDDKLEELASKPAPDNKKPFKVNYFEKDDETGEVRRISQAEQDAENEDETTFDEWEMEEEMADIQAGFGQKVQQLQQTYEQLSTKASVLERILAKHGPPGALEALNKALKSFDKDHSGGGDGPEDDVAAIEIPRIEYGRPGIDLSKSKVEKFNYQIAQLNNWMEKSMGAIAANKLSSQQIARTWSYFGALLPVLVKPSVVVPTEVWQALWKIFSSKGNVNPARMARVNGLAKAMAKAGVPITDEQQLLAIEAAFMGGDATAALTAWKRLVAQFDNKGMLTMAYWELGVRMWSEHGDVQRAERASKALLDRASPATPADSRVLLHLIQVYCKWPATADKGFQLYRRMRELAQKMKKPMEIDDYDKVISVFLTAGHTDYAMFAFTDMMFAGAVDLYGQAKLPHGIKNQFFFGKWLKRLIGAGDLDGANSVLVFMQKNGVLAAAVQVNGLLGAWLRSGTVENRQKADKLAWSMIHSRRNFVDLRQRNRLTEWPVRLTDDRAVPHSKPHHHHHHHHTGAQLDYTMVPRASTETFVLLAENYRERGLFSRLEDLFVAWKECEMPSDALMMNELMMAAVAQEQGDKARELYNLMVHENDIVPNADTFTVLFSSLPVHQIRPSALTTSVAQHSAALARSIFCDMISLTWVFQDAEWRAKKGLLSETQAKLMLHSFRKAGDFAGVMAALEGLRDVMGFAITRNVLLEMIAEHERIDRPSPRTTRVVLNTTMRLQKMIEDMQQRGTDSDNNYSNSNSNSKSVAPDAVKDPNFLYRLLLDYYHSKIQQLAPQDGVAGQLLDRAREEMGVKWTDRQLAQRRWAELKGGKS